MTNPLIKNIKNRMIYYNQNWLGLICGPTGSGKSFSGLRIAEEVDDTFHIGRVVFTAEEFMQVLNNGMKQGQIIIWDEAGVGMASREWYSISNKAINYVLQTFRHLNLGVIFTTPSISYIDSQARRLFHSYIETYEVDRKRKQVKARWFTVSYSPRSDKIYHIYRRYKREKKNLTRINIPSKELIDAYEKKKKAFSQSLRMDVLEDVKIAKMKEKHRKLTDLDIMKTIKDEKIELDAYTLQFKFNIGKDRAYRIIKNYKKFSPTI